MLIDERTIRVETPQQVSAEAARAVAALLFERLKAVSAELEAEIVDRLGVHADVSVD